MNPDKLYVVDGFLSVRRSYNDGVKCSSCLVPLVGPRNCNSYGFELSCEEIMNLSNLSIDSNSYLSLYIRRKISLFVILLFIIEVKDNGKV